MKRDRILALLVIAFFVSVAFMGKVALTRKSHAYSFQDHAAYGDCIDWGTSTISLSGTATQRITTKCVIAEMCIAQQTDLGTTPAQIVFATTGVQTNTYKGTCVVGATGTLTTTPVGTTKINLLVVGYGKK